MRPARHISNAKAIGLIFCAVLLDAVQALLTATIVLLPFALFFTLLGLVIFGIALGPDVLSLAKKGGATRILTGLGAAVAEFIPVINALPAWTGGIVAIIIQERIREAKEKGEEADPRKLAAMGRLGRKYANRHEILRMQMAEREARESLQDPEA